MQFETPLTIDVLPVYEDYLAEYKKPFAAKLVFEVALKIYWRTVLTLSQENKCIWCECEMTHERKLAHSTTIEHMIPRSLGGADDPENYTVACSRCNSRRGSMLETEFRAFIAAGKLDTPKKKKKRNYGIGAQGRRMVQRAAFNKALATVNSGLTTEERAVANANRPLEEQYKILQALAEAGDTRTVEKIKALKAVLDGGPNPYEPDTRLWRQFERLSKSPRLRAA